MRTMAIISALFRAFTEDPFCDGHATGRIAQCGWPDRRDARGDMPRLVAALRARDQRLGLGVSVANVA